MENIFGGRKIYAGGYAEKSRRMFNQFEIDQVAQATVVPSQYGMSLCFLMRAGFKHYIPVARDSKCTIGQVVDLTKAIILKLTKNGEVDIDRILIE